MARDFRSSPAVKTLRFHCRGHGFDPWSANQDPECHAVGSKEKRKEIKNNGQSQGGKDSKV